jgi:glycosyltransferase involved in cell wall biosynthesis
MTGAPDGLTGAADEGTRGARPIRVALVTHSVYEEDPRLRRQAQALTGAGIVVDVIALERVDSPVETRLDGATIVHVPVGRHQGAGLVRYVAEYASFLLRGGWALTSRHRRRRYDVVSVASPPDPLVFAALPLRLVGVPVILDLHEATPEFFRSRFPKASNRWSQVVLHLAERVSIAMATVSLSVNQARHRRLLDLGYRPDRLRVVTNGPSLGRFRPAEHPPRLFMADGSLRLIYTGAVTPLYELDVVVRSVAAIRERRPDLDVRMDVYGRGDAEPVLRALADELGIGERLALHGRIPLEDVAAAVAASDVGLSPLSADPFTEISMPTKALEYSAMGKPSIVADTLAAREHFKSDDLGWYASGDVASMTAALLRFVDDPAVRERARIGAQERATELSWDLEAPFYVELVRALARRDPIPPPRAR